MTYTITKKTHNERIATPKGKWKKRVVKKKYLSNLSGGWGKKRFHAGARILGRKGRYKQLQPTKGEGISGSSGA